MNQIQEVSLSERLRRFIVDSGFHHNARLPPERDLCGTLGVSRGELRKALAELENDGLIWRHVGRGTFVGSRPVLNLLDVEYLEKLARPIKVIEARLAIEPELARLSAIHGAKADFDEIRNCSQKCRDARDWRTYEAWDNNFHLAIAKATHNKVLIHLFDTLNVVRRSIVWGQLRASTLPPRTHPSFHEHDLIIAAISSRDAAGAATLMREHLASVRDRVIPALSG
ncbi:MAG: FadR family transcriptional regulator [Rhodospirillales bacterium]|nr:FadR family transcriptional regulator [Rhodospirillales bacterium]